MGELAAVNSRPPAAEGEGSPEAAALSTGAGTVGRPGPFDPHMRSSAWQSGMAGLLAWRNLAYDRARLAVTLTGVTFAVVLVAIQIGLFLGFSETTTTVIRNTRADLWIAAKGTQTFETASPIGEREFYRLLSIPGVRHAEPLIVQYVTWQKPSGGDEGVMLIGFDLATGLAKPWNLVEGALSDLRTPDAVAVDTVYFDKLGLTGTGATVEINDHRARVVALTEGIRSFTTSPWVFTSFRNAQKMTGLLDGQTNYFIAQASPDVDVQELRDAIQAVLPDASVYGSEEFAERTRDYWMLSTGAGAALMTAALLGLMVGAVIVAQVLYATTMDHIAEFGTLRAMGAPRSFIYRVIAGQALFAGLIGHAAGISVALVVAKLSENFAALILVPLPVVVGLLPLTLLMCVLASMMSIRKAMTIDPALVFQR